MLLCESLRYTSYAPRTPTMANGGSLGGLCGEGRRLAVAFQVHPPPHVQRGQTTGSLLNRLPIGGPPSSSDRTTNNNNSLFRSENHHLFRSGGQHLFRSENQTKDKKVLRSPAQVPAVLGKAACIALIFILFGCRVPREAVRMILYYIVFHHHSCSMYHQRL